MNDDEVERVLYGFEPDDPKKISCLREKIFTYYAMIVHLLMRDYSMILNYYLNSLEDENKRLSDNDIDGLHSFRRLSSPSEENFV